MRFATRALSFALLLTCAASRALAGEGGPLEEHYSLGLGTFFMSSDTRVRADAFESADVGTQFDYEDTFGLHDDRVFRVDGSWRFAPRHQLRLMYFQSDRSESAVLDEEIDFGDQTYPIDVEVEGRFGFAITEVAYEYVFLDHDSYELGASLGIHNAAFKLTMDAQDVTPGGVGSGASIEETARANAPLPVLGLRGRWRVAGDLYAMAHAQYFQLEYGAFDGNIQDYEASLVWQLTHHVGLGAAYNLFVTEIDADDGNNFQGHLRWTYEGLQLFMRMSF